MLGWCNCSLFYDGITVPTVVELFYLERTSSAQSLYHTGEHDQEKNRWKLIK